jgi:hypothetical protein
MKLASNHIEPKKTAAREGFEAWGEIRDPDWTDFKPYIGRSRCYIEFIHLKFNLLHNLNLLFIFDS